MKKTLFVIDAYNLIYRMFYAIPEMHTREGIQVNAIFGVAKFLKSLAEENPDAYLVVATDTGKTFRSEIFTEYKGTRDRMPDNLRSQIDGVFELFTASDIEILGMEWYEADDIIGSISQQLPSDDLQVVIISSDKDLCQFVDDGKVHIYDAMKRKFMRRADVIEKFWVPPEQVRDYLAIVGDTSDNIPGLPGFGPKKTADLLSKYNTHEGIYEHIENNTPKMQEVLQSGKEMAFLSQNLASIVIDLQIDNIPLENFSHKLNSENYIHVLQKYEFKSLIPKDFQEEKKEKKVIEVIEIGSLWQLEEKMNYIQKNNSTIGVDIDNQGKIFFSLEWIVYEIDTRKVDTREFIENIFSEKIQISCYDMKALFTKLADIIRPLRTKTNQETLF